MGGIASTIGGLLGGSSGSSSAGKAVTNLPNLTQNTNAWQGLVNSNVSNDQYLQSLLPQIQGLFSQQYNNPYAPALQSGAGTAGTALTGVGNTALSNSANVSGAGNGLLDYINNVTGRAFDPQNVMYNQARQNATDQANVANAQYGLTGPYAASATNQAMQNFNTNWSNQQLEHMLSALQGAGSALGQGTSALTSASNLGTGGANNVFAGAGLPFNAYNTIGQNQQGAFNNLFGNVGNINGANTNTMNSLMNYINSALQQQTARFNAQQQGAASGAAGGEQLGQTIGDLLPMAASFF